MPMLRSLTIKSTLRSPIVIVVADRDHGEREERRHHRGDRSDRVGPPVRGLGRKSSLKNSLMPSASVWRRPNGPHRFGPIRDCMSAMTLRSNQMTSSVTSNSATNTITTLIEGDDHGRPRGSRSTSSCACGPHRDGSVRAEIRSVRSQALLVVRHEHAPARDIADRRPRARDFMARRPLTTTSSPSATPTALRVLVVDLDERLRAACLARRRSRRPSLPSS